LEAFPEDIFSPFKFAGAERNIVVVDSSFAELSPPPPHHLTKEIPAERKGEAKVDN